MWTSYNRYEVVYVMDMFNFAVEIYGIGFCLSAIKQELGDCHRFLK